MAEVQEKVSLASLLTPSKTVTIDYPGIDGFERIYTMPDLDTGLEP